MAESKFTQDERDQAIDWLLRLRDPACTDTEHRAFAQWLEARAGRRQQYEKLRAHWNQLDQFEGLDFPVATAARRYRARSQRNRIIRLAAAAALLLAVGLTGLSPNGWYGQPVTYQTARGERQSVLLADGTLMDLNSDSRVIVRYNYWNRLVDLQTGEAYFNVIHDARRSFQVKAGETRCIDLGTAFDVFRQGEKIRVAVAEGRVRVEGKGQDRRDLVAGQAVALAQDGQFMAPTAQSNLGDLTAWRRGELVFDNRRLDEVLAELGRYQRQSLRLGDNSLASLRVSGSFHLDRLDQSLETITLTLPIAIERLSPDEIVLRRRQ